MFSKGAFAVSLAVMWAAGGGYVAGAYSSASIFGTAPAQVDAQRNAPTDVSVIGASAEFTPTLASSGSVTNSVERQEPTARQVVQSTSLEASAALTCAPRLVESPLLASTFEPATPQGEPLLDVLTVDNLLARIGDVAATGDSADSVVLQRQDALLREVERSPALLQRLASAYATLAPGAERELAKMLLASASSEFVEQYALNQLSNDPDDRWFDLLRERGIDGAAARQVLVDALPRLTDTPTLVSAIEALAPAVVPARERELIVAELRAQARSSDARVRSAAVEAVAEWGDEKNADVIEGALFDESPAVRRAALFAAFSSTIRSDGIMVALADIMTDSNEDWQLRMEAYSALSSYAMDGEIYDDFYGFEQQRAALYDEQNLDS